MLLCPCFSDEKQIWTHRILTNCGDNSDGKIKRAGEFPLPAGAVRRRLEDHSLNLSVVILSEAVFLLQLVQLLLQRPFL